MMIAMRRLILQRLQRHHRCRCFSSSNQVFSASSLLLMEQVEPTAVQFPPIDTSKVQIVGSTKRSRKSTSETPSAPIAPPAPKKMLDRYADFQQQFPGHLVLMQVGDFFEVYGEDALKVSRLLDIGLTSVNKAAPVAMTGVPVRSVEGHLERLIRAGESVVLAEQFGTGGVRMDRRVTRVITPGTLTEEGLLQAGQNNFLLAVVKRDGVFGLAWIDISTGYFRLGEVIGEEELIDRLIKLNPREILVDHEYAGLKEQLKGIAIHSISAGSLSIQRIGQVYHRLFSDSEEEAFDQSRLLPFSPPQLAASCVLLEYVLATQLDRRPYIEFPAVEDASRVMHIDRASFRSLEILQSNNNNSDDAKASLLGTVDNTKTAGGSRLLARRLQSPSLDVNVINARLDFVEQLLGSPVFLEELSGLLRGCKDLERCYQRLALNRSSGGPRDMQLILQTLGEIDLIKQALQKHSFSGECCAMFTQVLADLSDFGDLIGLLSTALNERLPYRVSDGLVIKAGFSQRLDDLRNGTGDVRKARSLLENKYRNLTGKSSLRIDEGRILGFFVEVSRSEGPIAPELAEFHLDGQTESKFRYRTSALNALKDSHAVNEARILEEESIVYEGLRQRIIARGPEIVLAAKAIAELDVAASMATTAQTFNFTRPIIAEHGYDFTIKDGRHPVVESIQTAQGKPFIGNDCHLGDRRFALITGPNMGGKSTFLRQNALIAILAQCGSFVPAASAHLGIVDAVYTRIGASDDLAQDRSTFMLEMMETAGILRGATPRSLVIMDEIGRGTATEEGFALAWAIAEHLIRVIGCRTLFATHYYDLARLTEMHPGCTAALQTTASVTDDGSGISFLHKLVPGVASYSYAIQIGRFAGLPESVLNTAQQKLEAGRAGTTLPPRMQIPLDLDVDMDEVSPREAHAILSRLVNNNANNV